MVRTIALITTFSILVSAPAVSAQSQPKTSPAPPGVGAGAPPQTVASFGGLRAGDAVVEGWKVSGISFAGRELSVTVSGESHEPLTLVFSPDSGPKGAFDTDNVRIYYRRTAVPQPTIGKVGKAIVDRVVEFASKHGGMQRYLSGVVAREFNNNPEYNVSREMALRFLGRLDGKWNVTVLQWDAASSVPRTLGTGTAQRNRFLNDFIVREDAEGSPGKQFMAVGCSAEAGRCWLFLLDNTWGGFMGGWAIFSESENALKIIDPATAEPVMSLRIVDESRNVLELYGPGPHARIIRTIRYDRAK